MSLNLVVEFFTTYISNLYCQVPSLWWSTRLQYINYSCFTKIYQILLYL